jgi:hypothetical protein
MEDREVKVVHVVYSIMVLLTRILLLRDKLIDLLPRVVRMPAFSNWTLLIRFEWAAGMWRTL